MKRKVIQDFANVFCQRFIDVPSGYDLATLVHSGSGTASLNVLTGHCTFNDAPIRSLDACAQNKSWLEERCHKHGISVGDIICATMTVEVRISNVAVKTSFGYTKRSASFAFVCQSQITTDEKRYVGHAAGERVWGFDFYWERLYGPLEPPTAVLAQ